VRWAKSSAAGRDLAAAGAEAAGRAQHAGQGLLQAVDGGVEVAGDLAGFDREDVLAHSRDQVALGQFLDALAQGVDGGQLGAGVGLDLRQVAALFGFGGGALGVLRGAGRLVAGQPALDAVQALGQRLDLRIVGGQRGQGPVVLARAQGVDRTGQAVQGAAGRVVPGQQAENQGRDQGGQAGHAERRHQARPAERRPTQLAQTGQQAENDDQPPAQRQPIERAHLRISAAQLGRLRDMATES
jgi:hypothetical protein